MKYKKENITSIAQVTDNADGSLNGRFRAKIDFLGGIEKDVNYVSPYASTSEGGFIAIPEPPTKVLVCSPNGSSDWYYIGATFDPEPGQPLGSKVPDSVVYPLSRVDPNTYKARGIPMRMNFKSSTGAGLTISDEYNPKYINKKVELKSSVNKKVTLNDSPAIDSVLLESGNGARILLSDNPQNQSIPARAIQVESVGPQKHINIESQTDIVVVDGRELQLLNNSTGAKAPAGAPNEAGNVNIQSKWKDVNVFSQAEQGRIFIQCLNENGSNQVIQIETKGSGGAIRIKTGGNVEIEADAIAVQTNTLDLNATSQLNMQSPTINLNGNVNAPLVNSSFNGNLNGTAAYATTAGIAALGTPAPVIGAVPLVPPVIPNIGDSESYYGTTGVTTY